MSGTMIDLNGATVDEDATPADFVAVETPNTHVGIISAGFTFSWQGATLTYYAGQDFIAPNDLYAALNASSVAAARITWVN